MFNPLDPQQQRAIIFHITTTILPIERRDAYVPTLCRCCQRLANAVSLRSR